MNFTKQHPVVSAAISATLFLPLTFAIYFAMEPRVAIGQVPQESEFTITQVIDDELAFTVEPDPVTLTGTLGGLIGGTSNGDTSFTVSTNSPTGYTVTINFSQANAMVNDDSDSFFIPNLGAFEFDLTPTSTAVTQGAAFAYTVTGGTHVDGAFAESGSSCGSGTTFTSTNCWFLDEQGDETTVIVDSDDPTTGSGDETNLFFRVVVDANPSIALPSGGYTATATLTATVK